MEVRDKEGKLNGVEVQRLKEKLGTRQVPTAELLLDGAKAHRVCKGQEWRDLTLIDFASLFYLKGMDLYTRQTHLGKIKGKDFKVRDLSVV